MDIFIFFLELYFAATLTISGTAKIANRGYFLQVMRNQKLVPIWSSQILSRVIPFLEIFVALFLLSGKIQIVTAIVVVLIFVIFLGIKIFLITTGYSEDCGCYGVAKKQDIDVYSIIVSSIVVLLAFLHWYLVVKTTLISWHWYLIATIIFVCFGSFLLFRTFIGRNTSTHAANELLSPFGGIDIGMKAPNIEGVDQYNNIFNHKKWQGQLYALAFVMPGCSGCTKLFETLQQRESHLENLTVFALSSAPKEENKEYAKMQKIPVSLLTVSPELIRETYKVRTFPLVFLVDELGIIRAKGIVNTENHLQQLLNQIIVTAAV